MSRKANSFPQALQSTTHANALITIFLTNAETVCLLARDASAIAFRSSAVKRTGTIRPLAVPFGNRGRPSLAFFCAKVSSDYRNLLVSTEYVCHAYYCITII
jgi:hypothetical protein